MLVELPPLSDPGNRAGATESVRDLRGLTGNANIMPGFSIPYLIPGYQDVSNALNADAARKNTHSIKSTNDPPKWQRDDAPLLSGSPLNRLTATRRGARVVVRTRAPLPFLQKSACADFQECPASRG